MNNKNDFVNISWQHTEPSGVANFSRMREVSLTWSAAHRNRPLTFLVKRANNGISVQNIRIDSSLTFPPIDNNKKISCDIKL